MSFLDNVFGATGCNPDGSMGQNAFTQFLDQTMDGSMMMTPQQQLQQQMMQEEMARQMGIESVPEMMTSAPMQMPSVPLTGMNAGAAMGPNPTMMMSPMMWSMQQMLAQQFVYQQQQQQMMMQHQMQYHSTAHANQYEDQHYHQEQHHHFDELQEEEQQEDVLNDFLANATIEADQNMQEASEAQSRWNVADSQQMHHQHHAQPTVSLSYAFEQDNPYLQHSSIDETTAAAHAETVDEADLEQLFQQGMQYYQEGHLQPAILSFEAILQHPSVANNQENSYASSSWRMLGLIQAENDQETKAIHCLQTALSLDAYASESLPVLATCLFNEQRSVEALESIQQFVQTSPLLASLDTPEVLSEVSSTLPDSVRQELGETAGRLLTETLTLLQTAVEKLRIATQLDQTNEALRDVYCDCAVMRGLLFNIAMDFDKAISSFEEALKMKPQDHSLQNKLAATLANSNRSETAIPIYTALLQTRPRYPRAWMNLGISHANLQQYAPAAAAYVKALHYSPEARHIWGYLRVVLSCMERFDLVQMSGQEDKLYEIASALGVEGLE